MGTRGYYVFKYNGIYYIFYNHYDSYFSGLGQSIVDHINESIKNDINWIKTLKKLLDKVKLIEQEQDGASQYENIIMSLTYAEQYVYHTSEDEPSNNLFIEFVYIIDIDMMKFKVIPSSNEYYNSKVFNLTSIPKDWAKICTIDPESDIEEEEEEEEKVEDVMKDNYTAMMNMMTKMMEKIEKIEKAIEVIEK
jgi:hypothetical protein